MIGESFRCMGFCRASFSPLKPLGFTIVELMVVLAILGLLLSLAIPRFVGTVSLAKESVLRENLWLMRKAIDEHYADRGDYPKSLEELVERRYLRSVPIDPVTESRSSWVLVSAANGTKNEPSRDPSRDLKRNASRDPSRDSGLEQAAVLEAGLRDVQSGSPETARDGTGYASW